MFWWYYLLELAWCAATAGVVAFTVQEAVQLFDYLVDRGWSRDQKRGMSRVPYPEQLCDPHHYGDTAPTGFRRAWVKRVASPGIV